jgi:hypothetical protein
MSNLPMSNCQDTVVNWLLLRNNFVTLHVRPVLIGAINPFKKINVASLNLADVNKKLKWLDTVMYSSPVSNLIKVRSRVRESAVA